MGVLVCCADTFFKRDKFWSHFSPQFAVQSLRAGGGALLEARHCKEDQGVC